MYTYVRPLLLVLCECESCWFASPPILVVFGFTPSRVLLCRIVCLQKLHVPVPLLLKSGSLCLVTSTPYSGGLDSSCLSVISVWMKKSRPNPSNGVSACWSMPLSWVIQWSVLDLCFGRLPRGVFYSIHYANSNSQLLTSQLYVNSSRQ